MAKEDKQTYIVLRRNLPYKEINCGQSFDTIGREIDSQIHSNPETLELRYSRVRGTDNMFKAEALEGNQIPALEDYTQFVDTTDTEGLSQILTAEAIEQAYPKVIRVIRPNPTKDSWSVFFQTNYHI